MKTSGNKINDLSNSALRKRFMDKAFTPETNQAVAMGRVSTKGQKDRGQSDAAQMETIDNYALKESLNIVKAWDVAESASKHDKRKNFHAMLDFVRDNPQIKHIIFSHQSRSNRNRESARELENLVRNQGLTLHCARDGLRLTAKSSLEDWMRWDLFNNLNEKFIEDHRRNVMDGIIKRIERGWSPNKAPYGYRNHRPHDNAESTIIIEEAKAPFVRKAFELFGTGRYSEVELLAYLKGLYPDLPKALTTKGFSKMLRNPFYMGEFEYDGQRYKGVHDPLIAFEMWKRAQDVLNEPHRNRQKVTDRQHPYLGLIRCGGKLLDEHGHETDQPCGCAISGEEKRKRLSDGTIRTYFYYLCSRRIGRCSQQDKDYLARHGRRKVYYSEAELEALMREIFVPLHFPDELAGWMKETLLQHHKEVSGDQKQHRQALQRRYEMLQGHISRAYEDKLNGLISEDLWREKNEGWRVEQEQIRCELAALGHTEDDYMDNAVLVLELAQQAVRLYEKGNAEKKRKLVEIACSNRILVNGKLRFDYQKPFDILAKIDSKELWWTLVPEYRTVFLHAASHFPHDIKVLLAG